MLVVSFYLSENILRLTICQIFSSSKKSNELSNIKKCKTNKKLVQGKFSCH